MLMINVDQICYGSEQQRRRLISHANAKSKSEKFPPPHQDGQLGYPLGASNHIDPDIIPPDVPFSSTSFTYSKEPFQAWSGPIGNTAAIDGPKKKKKLTAADTLDLSKPHRIYIKDKVKGKKIKAQLFTTFILIERIYSRNSLPLPYHLIH